MDEISGKSFLKSGRGRQTDTTGQRQKEGRERGRETNTIETETERGERERGRETITTETETKRGEREEKRAIDCKTETVRNRQRERDCEKEKEWKSDKGKIDRDRKYSSPEGIKWLAVSFLCVSIKINNLL